MKYTAAELAAIDVLLADMASQRAELERIKGAVPAEQERAMQRVLRGTIQALNAALDKQDFSHKQPIKNETDV